ncbi:MAG: SDR family NAD(P)-dependent oxidoreductase [Halobacteriota archaeon]
MQVDLSDQTVIVTGAGRGIGAVIARRFGEVGANVVAAARTTEEIEATAADIEAAGGDALAVTTDLRNVEDIDALVDATVEAFGVPQILVNNAAQNLTNLPFEQTLEEVDDMLDTNLRGLFLLSQRFGERLRESDVESGRIVNIASISGHIGVPAMTVYGGTKGGVIAMTRGLASELAEDNVTVNSISPGLIEVERIRKLIAEKGDQIYDFDRLPLERLGTPDDIANTALFLSSEFAEYITGEDIRVDGGVGFTAGMYKS